MAIENLLNTIVNGLQLEFADVQLNGGPDGSIPITKGGVQSISYEWTLEPGIVNTNQIGVSGQTRGSVTSLPTGSMQILPAVWDSFVAQTIAPFGDGTITGAFFGITVSMAIANLQGSYGRVDQLITCRVTSANMNMQKGSDNLFYDVKFTFQNIKQNGVLAWPLAE